MILMPVVLPMVEPDVAALLWLQVRGREENYMEIKAEKNKSKVFPQRLWKPLLQPERKIPELQTASP